METSFRRSEIILNSNQSNNIRRLFSVYPRPTGHLWPLGNINGHLLIADARVGVAIPLCRLSIY